MTVKIQPQVHNQVLMITATAAIHSFGLASQQSCKSIKMNGLDLFEVNNSIYCMLAAGYFTILGPQYFDPPAGCRGVGQNIEVLG